MVDAGCLGGGVAARRTGVWRFVCRLCCFRGSETRRGSRAFWESNGGTLYGRMQRDDWAERVAVFDAEVRRRRRLEEARVKINRLIIDVHGPDAFQLAKDDGDV